MDAKFFINTCRTIVPRISLLSVVHGVAAGLYLVLFSHAWVTLFSTGPESTSAAVAISALAVCLSWRLPGVHRGTGPTELQAAGFHVMLAAWTMFLPLLMNTCLNWRTQLMAAEEHFFGQWWLYLIASAAAILGPPLFCLGRFLVPDLAGSAASAPSTARSFAASSAGCALGIGMATFGLGPWLGAEFIGWSAAAVSAGLLPLLLVRGLHTEPNAPSIAAESSPSAGSEDRFPLSLAAVACGSVGGGALLAALGAVLDQLMPSLAFVTYARWLALFLGMAGGAVFCRRFRPAVVWAVAAMWSAAVLLLFPVLIRLMLTLNANVSHAVISILLRSLLIVVVIAPLGWAWSRSFQSRGQTQSGGFAWQPLLFAAGWVAAQWVMFVQLGPAAVAGIAVGLLSAAVLWETFRSKTAEEARGFHFDRRAIAATAVPLCAVIAATAAALRFDPVRPARLLFSTQVFTAYRSGWELPLLSGLDDGFHFATHRGRAGTYTFWKTRAWQVQIRRDGVPVGTSSLKPGLCPQYSGEVMTAALPLILHEQPHRVLFLGLGAGEPVAACLAFPVQQLTCAEADTVLTAAVGRHVWSHLPVDPRSDPRLAVRAISPTAALHGQETYEVVISNPGPAALWKATPEFLVEFYQQAAESLTEDGIFCQRFQHADYGPGPLATAVAGMQRAFREVAAVETAADELVLLGTNSTAGLARPGLVQRLQMSHARRVLSRIGWDWSVVLNLNAWNTAGLADFAAAQSAEINTAASGRFAFGLAHEMFRWGVKQDELQSALGPHRSRLLEWIGDEGTDPYVLDRLAEVVGQRKLMMGTPDEWWTYRRELRRQVATAKPPPLIQRVSHQGIDAELSPDVKRRIEYFQALSSALNDGPPTQEEIARLSEYFEPYDPLLSHFLHHELARLHARAEPRDYAREFDHRLHAVNFAAAGDRSVRDVTAALRLLLDHPEAVPDDEDRFNQLNSLLQLLKHRWDNRRATAPESAGIGLNDTGQSIAAAESALDAMDELSRHAVPDEHWDARRKFLQRALIAPLRHYRDQLLQHRHQPPSQQRAPEKL